MFYFFMLDNDIVKFDSGGYYKRIRRLYAVYEHNFNKKTLVKNTRNFNTNGGLYIGKNSRFSYVMCIAKLL